VANKIRTVGRAIRFGMVSPLSNSRLSWNLRRARKKKV
jgi:hypothetical protein